MATSLCPESNGATRGSSASRSVERSTSMYATTRASLVDHTVRSARPRPFSSRCTAVTRSSSCASRRAIAQVPSVLALSATVIAPRHREALGEVAVEVAHRPLEIGLLVVHGDHDLDRRRRARARGSSVPTGVPHGARSRVPWSVRQVARGCGLPGSSPRTGVPYAAPEPLDRAKGRPRAEQVRRLPDPPDVATDRDSPRAVTATSTTATGSTGTRTTASSTSASAPRCTRTSASSTAASASSATASSTRSMRRAARRSSRPTCASVRSRSTSLEPMRRMRVDDRRQRHRHRRRPHVHRAYRVRRGGAPDPCARSTSDHGRHPLRAVRLWEGEIRYDGTTVPIDATRVYGTKDRSWGFRGSASPIPGLARRHRAPPRRSSSGRRCTGTTAAPTSACSRTRTRNRWHSDGAVLPVYASPADIPGAEDPGIELLAGRRARPRLPAGHAARRARGASRWSTRTASARTSTSSRSSASA